MQKEYKSSWNKGLTKDTDERVMKSARSMKGRISPNKGKKTSEEIKQKMSASWDYKKHFTKETLLKLRKKHKPFSEEIKQKMRKPKKYTHIAWNKGLTKDTDERVKKYAISGAKTRNSEEWKNSPIGKKFKIILKENRKNNVFPKKDTSIEIKIQNFLKHLRIEFFTHQYVNKEYGYQCDILIPIQDKINQKTIIECYGNYWHNYPKSREIDIKRCQELREQGWRVLVFWEKEIKVMEIEDFKQIL